MSIRRVVVILLVYRSIEATFFTPCNRRLFRTSSSFMMVSSAKIESPAAERNKEPIWNVLESRVVSRSDTATNDSALRVLEIAAGSGIHTHCFANKLIAANRPFDWYPTDPDPSALASIQAYIDDGDEIFQSHVHKPSQVTLNSNGIQEKGIELRSIDLVIAINLIHISPWSATEGLFKTASQSLKSGGVLYLYGPYRVCGTTVESNM
jgi:SAM-dependent methyltransferase